ncbi:MAG: hypothetical protein RI894_1260, partial [Bacteroidota bacterium]
PLKALLLEAVYRLSYKEWVKDNLVSFTKRVYFFLGRLLSSSI